MCPHECFAVLQNLEIPYQAVLIFVTYLELEAITTSVDLEKVDQGGAVDRPKLLRSLNLSLLTVIDNWFDGATPLRAQCAVLEAIPPSILRATLILLEQSLNTSRR